MMSANSDKVNLLLEEVKNATADLREVVYSAPSQWQWDSLGSAVSIEQIAEIIEKIESDIKKIQQYCDEEYKEATELLVGIMWSGLQSKNHEAILHAAIQLINQKLNFSNEPFGLKLDNK